MNTRYQDNHVTFVELPAGSVSELSRAKEFFEQVFGWSYTDWGGDYADTKDSGLESGINADPGHRPRHPLPVIYTTDLDTVRQKVISANGTVTREVFSFPGGRRFHFSDPSGNELAVWSDI